MAPALGLSSSHPPNLVLFMELQLRQRRCGSGGYSKVRANPPGIRFTLWFRHMPCIIATGKNSTSIAGEVTG